MQIYLKIKLLISLLIINRKNMKIKKNNNNIHLKNEIIKLINNNFENML